MIQTQTYLYTKRMKTELKAIKGHLNLLLGMVQDDVLDYNLKDALDIITDIQKKARDLDSMSTNIWLKLHAASENEEAEEAAENEPVQPGF